MARPRIRLSDGEDRLRRLLLDVSQYIEKINAPPKSLILRWAGGWVRDKLLGIETHDIDVAINTMTGYHFASHMRDYCSTPEAMIKHSILPDDIGSLHNIARNPDKSKHLETAMAKVFGIDVDFVNLRKETYADDSRNPQAEFGTAEEDALRRDATINALFFNLHTLQVEDFTGGMTDMSCKLIRTPLEPLQTFTDDPLRVLRLVRFASRLCFSIDPAAEKAMSQEKVLAALNIKISRERVGIEVEKMLRGNDPSRALQLIDKLKLYRAIFTDPTRDDFAVPDTRRWHVSYRCLREMVITSDSPGSIGELLLGTQEILYLAWNVAAMSLWLTIDCTTNDGSQGDAKISPPIVAVARQGLKAPKRLTDLLAACHRNRGEIIALKRAVCDKESFIYERDRLGMAIRRWEAQGGFWTLQLLGALLSDAMQQLDTWPEAGASDSTCRVPAVHESADEMKGRTLSGHSHFMQEWQKFLDHLVELDVYNAPALKRLLDGNSLAQALGVKPGRWTGKALDVCLSWQMRHPGETDPRGAIDEVRRRRDELGIPTSR